MPQVGMSEGVQRIVGTLALNPPYLGATRIAKALVDDWPAVQARVKVRKDEAAPSVSQVSRTLVKIHGMSDEEKRRYRLALWPDAFGTVDLPWEAAASTWELAETHLAGRIPTIPMAVWYWRVHLAMPKAKSKEKFESAKRCALRYEYKGASLGEMAEALFGVPALSIPQWRERVYGKEEGQS